jgi:sigma-B regulation protein RsbU (phosphoserine phosphatase)
MNNGAFDFATKPIDLDDLSVTIEKAIEQIDYVHKMQFEHQQLESLKTDLAVASEIQQAILPRVFPPFPELVDQIDMAALMVPAKDVGGDFYDIFRIDEDHFGFTIADVSGKGIPAAIFMAVSRTLIRATGIRGGSPSDCLAYSNKLLSAESVDCMFVTVFYGIYNIKTGEVTYCNAGHNPPYLLKSNGEVKALPLAKDPMVGAISDIEYHEESIQLEKGEMLILFTDGVTEAMSADFQMYSDARLHRNLSGMAADSCQQIIDTIKADIATHTEDAEQSDDITMLVLKRLQ